MLSYCLKCRKNIESKNPKVLRIKNGRMMLCTVCGNKKSTFIKEPAASGMLASSS